MERLRGILTAMAENLAFQLRRGGKLTACIAVKIRYSDFNTYSRQQHIVHTSADHILIPKILELFDRLYDRRLLVRLIGVRFTDLVSGHYQIDLFDDAQETLGLYTAMDRIRERFGERSVLRASGMGSRTIGRMHNPFDGRPPVVLAHRKQ